MKISDNIYPEKVRKMTATKPIQMEQWIFCWYWLCLPSWTPPLNAFTSTTRHSYHSCTIMLSPFTVMFTGIWCGIRGDALINPPGHCKEFGHEKWAVCCWATRPPDNWYHLEGSGTHEMILCLLLLLLMLLLLLPLLLFLLWFFLFVLFPNSLE